MAAWLDQYEVILFNMSPHVGVLDVQVLESISMFCIMETKVVI